jgi:hypothetical protein
MAAAWLLVFFSGDEEQEVKLKDAALQITANIAR